MGLEIERIGYACGARVAGIDLRRPLDEATASEIRAAWIEHHVLYFPGQDLTPEQFIAFTKTFGTIDDNSRSPSSRHPDYPDMILLNNKPRPGRAWTGYRSGEIWHSDFSETQYPTSASLLLCKELPKVGGNTMFANQYMAYDTLSKGVQETLERMESIHDKASAKNSERRGSERLEELRKLKPPFVQPVVRVHPLTGRKSLYVNERVKRFKDWTVEESRPLLEQLIRHATQDDFCYRHRWTIGDLAIWDNRCLLHKALGDFDMWNEPREMFRTSVYGEKSGYVFAGDSVEPFEGPKTHAVATS